MIRYSGKSEREEAPSFPPCLVDFSRLCSRGGFPFISRRSFDYFIIIYSTLAAQRPEFVSMRMSRAQLWWWWWCQPVLPSGVLESQKDPEREEGRERGGD